MVTVANCVTQLPLPPHYPTLVYNRNVLLAKPVQIRDTEQLQMQPETAKQSFGCRGMEESQRETGRDRVR